MNEQDIINFNRIAGAIDYIKNNFKEQPNLDEVAEKVNLSPFHFQRLFKEWAGVTPKKFLQYTSIEYAKNILKNNQITLSEVTHKTGLSSTGRLHDLFIKIEGMTPGEFKNDGENLSINYSFSKSPFGNILIASTVKGICHMAFAENENIAFKVMTNHFPKANFYPKLDLLQQNALNIFSQDWSKINKIKFKRNRIST
jgi:AraC family transcriptional regulator, regulatory protein of adaptative response / methylated-DNA-[protein]-cysteine methyltransferase